MQQLEYRPQPDQQANRGGAPRSQVILIVALLLFSVAGLTTGFSVGALTGKTSKTATPTPITNIMPPQKGQSSPPTPKPTVTVIPLGCPQPMKSSSIYQGIPQVSDGITNYTFTAQAMDTTGDQPAKNIFCPNTNRPIHVAGITFKLWIIKYIGTKTLNLPNRNPLTQPIDGKVGDKDYPELQNKLQFETTPQVQQSNNQGQVTWNYQINPDLKEGMYTLVVLADWQGKTRNWYWVDLVVKKQG